MDMAGNVLNVTVTTLGEVFEHTAATVCQTSKQLQLRQGAAALQATGRLVLPSPPLLTVLPPHSPLSLSIQPLMSRGGLQV